MSRSDARPDRGPPDEDGPTTPWPRRGRPVARALSWATLRLRNNFRLRSDDRRQGQEAFTSSPFSRLCLTHLLSLGGDAMVTVALAGSLFFNISVTAARGRVALSLLLTVAPFAIVAPFLGPIIDRAKGGRRAMIFATALGRVVACLFMARYIHGLLLFPAAFLTLVCSKTYTVAKAALVPSVVEHNDDLVEANSKLAIGGGIAGLLAAIPAVPILKLFGAAALLRVDSVVFIVCAASAFRLVSTVTPRVARTAARPEAEESAASPAGSLPPGTLTAATIGMAALRFTVGFMVFLVAFAFRRTHAPAWWYGVILASSVGGNLVGAAIAPRLRGRVREEYILAGSIAAVILAGLLLVPFSVFQRRPAASVLAVVVGIGAGAGKLAFDSLVQREVPAAAQGRTFGRLEAMFQLVWVLGALTPVVIAMSLGVGDLVVTVVAIAALGTYLAGARLARQGHLPAWWPGMGTPPTGPDPAIGGPVGVAPVGDGADPGGGGPTDRWTAPPWADSPWAPTMLDGGVLGGPALQGGVGPERPLLPPRPDADGPAPAIGPTE